MTNEPVRRLILFAGFCGDAGNVTRSDIEYIRELSRFGEVYCWYDDDSLSTKSKEEIGQIAGGLWHGKHGEYDFGSWKRLFQARADIDLYDELILTNNSLIILDKLDRFFDFRTRCTEDFFSPLIVDEHYSGQDVFIDDYEASYDKFERSTMYTSAFWSLRKNLFISSFFENFINSIGAEENRLEVCYKYERGFSRSLWRHNISVATLIPKLFRYVPLYTEDAFLLPSMGFPFIKQKALKQEYYPIPDINSRCSALLQRVNIDYRDIFAEIAAKTVRSED